MIDKLKAFVGKHKQEFDVAEPSGDIWKKIDARLEVKNDKVSQGKWLSKFGYFGFGTSVLVTAFYFISGNSNNSASKTITQRIEDSALNNSRLWTKTKQNESNLNTDKNEILKSTDIKVQSENLSGHSLKTEAEFLVQSGAEDFKKDTIITNPAENRVSENSKVKNEEGINQVLAKEEKAAVLGEKTQEKSKRGGIYVPEEPLKMNTFSCTLYDASSLCSVVRAYKFPGKVSMDNDGNYSTHRTMKTMSCNRLADIENVKAVWLKGITSKKLSFSILEGFKNIVLLKSDGSKIYPVAISHYYSGLGVISDYTGKHFDMIFKDKVELILFFKEAGEGDKIFIDGIIEAAVKLQP